jgi:uncharacterized protein (TIGR03437 family)
VKVKVAIGDTNGNVVTVPLATYSPAIYESGGAVAALDAGYQAIGDSNPVRRGQVVQLFCNGLGPVTNQPDSGAGSSGPELSYTKAAPAVTIGGLDAPVSFSGLAPGFPGLYQVNATVPANLAAGKQPVVLSIGDQASKASTIAVQ